MKAETREELAVVRDTLMDAENDLLRLKGDAYRRHDTEALMIEILHRNVEGCLETADALVQKAESDEREAASGRRR